MPETARDHPLDDLQHNDRQPVLSEMAKKWRRPRAPPFSLPGEIRGRP
jgi:hypothetical protein